MSVWPAASRPGDTVTFTANLPADIDPESLIYTWQISPDGMEWIDMDSTLVPSYTIQSSARHYLNYLRVTVSADPEYVRPEPLNEAEAGEALPENTAAETENTENNSQPESEEQPQAAAAGANGDIASMAKRPLRRILMDDSNLPAAPAAVSSGGIMLTAESDGLVYWNPYSSPTFSEDGAIIVNPGKTRSDGADGSIASPYLLFSEAVADAAQQEAKTIVCMNLYSSAAGDNSLSSISEQIKIISYDGGGAVAAVHQV